MTQLTKETVIEFIPEAQRGEDDPLTVDILYCPNEVVQHYSSIVDRRTKNNRKNITSVLREVQQKQFLDKVKRVRNFVNLKGEPVTDIKDFFDTCDFKLIEEIIIAMEDAVKLTEGQIKNSKGASVTG